MEMPIFDPGWDPRRGLTLGTNKHPERDRILPRPRRCLWVMLSVEDYLEIPVYRYDFRTNTRTSSF